MTLTDFLLARVAEDESEPAWDETSAISRYGRVLAECDAKRKILAGVDGRPPSLSVVRLLALPYADHPDYRQEWKP